MTNKTRVLNKARRAIAIWLQDQEALPPSLKENPSIEELEARLFRRLQQAQANVESELVNQLAMRGRLPSTSRGQRKLINRVLDDMMGTLPGIIADGSQTAATAGREETVQVLQQLGQNIDFESLDPRTLDTLYNRAYRFSQDTFDRIKGNFAQTLGNAYRDGKGIDDAIKLIRDDFHDLRWNRLEAIARTETQAAQNEGAARTRQEYGVEYKQWLTVGDSRVRGLGPYDRFDHVEMHGEVVREDEKFSNGLDHPGDRSGELGNIINCRCRARPYIPHMDEEIGLTPYHP